MTPDNRPLKDWSLSDLIIAEKWLAEVAANTQYSTNYQAAKARLRSVELEICMRMEDIPETKPQQ